MGIVGFKDRDAWTNAAEWRLPEVASSSGQATRASVTYLAVLCAVCTALYAWYASGWPGPGRFWDEMYTKQNVAVLLSVGKFEPANGFYPTLAYLPQALVLAGLEALDGYLGLDRWQFVVDRTFTPQAYLASRGLSVVYAVASLGMVWWLGLRLFSLPVASSASTLLAFTPWHINRAGYFKPDSLVTLALLVFLFLTVRAVERPSRGRFAAAGAAIGIAMSCKFNAACAPAVLILGAASVFHRERRVVGHLIVAGLVAAGIFLVLNPQLELIFHDFFGRTTQHYQGAVDLEHTSWWHVAIGWIGFLFDRYAHGWLVAIAVFVGIGTLCINARRPEIDTARKVGWLLLASYPVLFALVISVGTERVKYNNYAPLLPITSLFAAVAICTAVERLVPDPRRRWVMATGVVLLWTGPGAFSYVYRSIVPTTEDAAIRHLERDLGGDLAGRPIVAFDWQRPRPDWESRRLARRKPLRLIRVSASDDVDAKRLAQADGWILPAAWLDERLLTPSIHADPQITLRSLKPRCFRLRGPELIVASRTWMRAGEAIELEPLKSGRSWVSPLEAPDPRELLSLELWIDQGTRVGSSTELQIGTRRQPLVRVAYEDRSWVMISERFAAHELSVRLGPEPARIRRAVLHRWRVTGLEPVATVGTVKTVDSRMGS